MIPVLLAKVKTRDGVALEGVVALPKRKTGTALVWLHGLSSRFSSGQPLVAELLKSCSRNGIGYFKFNTRGHDVVAKGKKPFIGSAFEKFEECIHDIRAVIAFAKRLGYARIILAGHSTGANKALYYMYKTRDRSVRGIILAGPVNDIVAETKRIGRKTLAEGLRRAEHLKQKDSHVLVPQRFGVYSARRYISLYKPGTAENVFPYYNPRARWKELKSVRIPLAIIFGSREEHIDRPARQLIDVFENNAPSAKSFSGIIIKGANHGFRNKEKELAREIIHWIKRV